MKQAPGNMIQDKSLTILSLVALQTVFLALTGWSDNPPPAPIAITATARYVEAVEAHLVYVTEHALDEYGPHHNPMWLSTIDIQTSRLPESFLKPARSPQPVGNAPSHHQIASSHFYRDQPTLVAAMELARRTGCKCYHDATLAYARAFLAASRGESFLKNPFLSACQYDVIEDNMQIDRVAADRWPIHSPAWEIQWQVDPTKTTQTIEHAANQLLSKRGVTASPELADYAMVLDSLSWLLTKTSARNRQQPGSTDRPSRKAGGLASGNGVDPSEKDDSRQKWLNLARRIAVKASVEGRPMEEVGVWIENLNRASLATGDRDFQTIASRTLGDWLDRNLATHTIRDTSQEPVTNRQGRSVTQSQVASTTVDKPAPEDRPRDAANDINARGRAMPLAEACLSLWASTAEEKFRNAAIHWAKTIEARPPATLAGQTTAGHYGRTIHFLVRAAEVLQDSRYHELAEGIADDAMNRLYEPNFGMFRSRVGTERCNASDEPGLLLLALFYLDGDDPTSGSAFHF